MAVEKDCVFIIKDMPYPSSCTALKKRVCKDCKFYKSKLKYKKVFYTLSSTRTYKVENK